MTPSEIESLVRVAASAGVKKLKITGGEPLMRDDLEEVITRVSHLVTEVSLTTNGHRLAERARDLKNAGLSRVNVSLHTLNKDVYTRLCGVDMVDSVVRGIESAVGVGLLPVKVNMVVLRGYNEGDIQSMMKFCAEVGAVLQLIEYEATKEGAQQEDFKKRFFSLKGVEEDLRRKAINTYMNELHRRGRYQVTADGGQVMVEVVRPMHNTEFCGNCTRIRLSSDGILKPCLLAKSGEVDMLTPLRAGASDADLSKLFMKGVEARKPYWG